MPYPAGRVRVESKKSWAPYCPGVPPGSIDFILMVWTVPAPAFGSMESRAKMVVVEQPI